MRKFGFKLFSKNLRAAPALVRECADAARTAPDLFVELMILPETTPDDLRTLQDVFDAVEIRLHAPHHTLGFDAGDPRLEKRNRETFETVRKAADLFKAKTIVVHPGCGHGKERLNETVRQLKLLDDPRIVVENLPIVDDGDGKELLGGTAEEISFIRAETGYGFCMDFSHAICAAATLGRDPIKHLESFYALTPTVYHLCDGEIGKNRDTHRHYGEGDYPLGYFLKNLTAPDAYITMETGRGVMKNADAWIGDYTYLKSKITGNS